MAIVTKQGVLAGAKLAATVATIVAGSALLFGAIGFVLNMILLLLIGPLLGGGAQGFAGVGQLFTLKNLLYGAIFLAGFPYLYGLFGAKHGIKKAVGVVGGKRIDDLSATIAEKFAAKTKIDRLTSDAVPRLIDYLKSLDGVPGSLRKVAAFFAKRIVPDEVQAIAKGQPAAEGIKQLLVAQVNDKLLSRSLTWLWILIVLNVVAFWLARRFF